MHRNWSLIVTAMRALAAWGRTDSDDSDGPRRNNPLSPYYPSEVPTVPGNTPRWFVLLVVLVLLLSTLAMLLPVFGFDLL